MKNPKFKKNILYAFSAIFEFILIFWIFPKINWNHFYVFINNLIILDLPDYPYQSPPVFFSIGEAIASIAILLAVYQLRKEKWLVALRVRSYIGPTVFLSMSLGIIFAVVSPFILIKNPTNVFQLSIFWQTIASILVAFSITFLLLKATNKNLFNRKNARKFYEVLVWELSRPSPERLDVILNALLENLENICKAANQNLNLDSTKASIEILNVVLGDGSLVDVVTTKRLDALYYILRILEKHNLTNQRAPGFSRILKNLFLDKSSFLYKHLENNGLAQTFNLYKSLFGSPHILSYFDPFGWQVLDYTMQKDLSSKQISVFIKTLSQAIETYLKNEIVPARNVNNGLSHLSEIFQNLCYKIYTEEKRGVDSQYALKDEWWSLHLISSFLGHDYPFLAYRDKFNERIVEQEKSTTEVDFHSQFTINAGIAAVIYKAFENLTMIEDTNDTYHNVLELLHGMIWAEQYKQGYRAPFEKRMWEQIATNVQKKCYPGVLRTYLIYIGLLLTSKVGLKKDWIDGQTERMRKLLYIDLKPLLDKKERMIDAMLMEEALLPTGLKYKKGKFIYTTGFGNGPSVEIQEPPTGSTSALEGVDIENLSLL